MPDPIDQRHDNASDRRQTNEVDDAFRSHVSYIDRSRRYYRSKGFTTPYRWLKHRSTPFTPLVKPLARATVGVVTTAFPEHAIADGDKKVMASPVSPRPESMFTDDLFWHKKATNTDDVETFLPLETLAGLAEGGTIGALADRFYSIPTLHSHRLTRRHGADMVDLCLRDGLDAVVLVPL